MKHVNSLITGLWLGMAGLAVLTGCRSSYPQYASSCPWDAAIPSCSPRVNPEHRRSFMNDPVYFGMQDVVGREASPHVKAIVYASQNDLPLRFSLTPDDRLRCAVEFMTSPLLGQEPFVYQGKEHAELRDAAAAMMRCQYWPRGATTPVALDERAVDCTFAPTGFTTLALQEPDGESIEMRFMCRRIPRSYLQNHQAPPGGIMWKEFDANSKKSKPKRFKPAR